MAYRGAVPFVENPRRFQRIRVAMTVELTHGTTWTAMALDFGPGGSLLYPGKPLKVGDRLQASFSCRDVLGKLTVTATVAWVNGGRCGLAFACSHERQAQRWFDELQQSRTTLGEAVVTLPERVPLDACVSRTGVKAVRALPSEEFGVLSIVSAATSVRKLILHSRLPPARFARAFFALMDKGLIAVDGASKRTRVARPAEAVSPGAERAALRKIPVAIASGVDDERKTGTGRS